jgi:FlaA1/EpsC-like NDP-sugar epimerase
MIFSQKYTPRWIVFVIDIFISIASVTLAYLLRFNFEIPEENVASLYFIIVFVAIIRIISFIIGKTYAGIVRYSGVRDAQRIFITIFLGSVFIVISNIVSYYFITKAFIVPLSIVIIDLLTTVFFMTALRWLVKAIFYEFRMSNLQVKQVVIYGTGAAAVSAKSILEQDENVHYKVIAFFDNVTVKSKKQLEGVPLIPLSKIELYMSNKEIDVLVLAKPFESVEDKTNIIELSLANNIQVLTVPSVENWVDGELSTKQIRQIKIEDLLERNPIVLDTEKIKSQINGKVVVVTGAAGSIGSEMVRQIVKYKPRKLVLFDQAETPLYDIEMELNEKDIQCDFEVVIGDVSDSGRVERVFGLFKPDIIYHAAAYKHVPMMEWNPAEAIKNNVLGTKIVADLAVKYKVSKFVMVSTDKAVNPTNIMGASKRIAEIYIQSLNEKSETLFVTTRFGNVLGSNGSVIPRFRQQIAEGGPITVTHPQITRFFMTIPEACQLVLEAGVMGNGGEIFIFDMGKSVKIVDLAKKMIKLWGLQLGKDIQIVFTGLRPGEKLYEELLANKENTLPTHHSKIMVAKVRKHSYDEISKEIDELIKLSNMYNNMNIVKKMKEIVPEFISQNSIYEQLDGIQV